jgi:2,3,4,5-tetrahydropyridine-2-carboxylate N-succinyltransferase
MTLESDIAELVAAGASADREHGRALVAQLREALSADRVRAAEPDAASATGWRVNAWMKQGILLGFRFGDLVDVSMDQGKLPFYDKDTLPLKRPGLAAGVRIIPGGSTVRDGAYVGEQTLIDSHALVGSCAQIGAASTSAPPRRSAASSNRSARCPW